MQEDELKNTDNTELYEPHRAGLHADVKPYPGEPLCYCDKPKAEDNLEQKLIDIFFRAAGGITDNGEKEHLPSKQAILDWVDREVIGSDNDMMVETEISGKRYLIPKQYSEVDFNGQVPAYAVPFGWPYSDKNHSVAYNKLRAEQRQQLKKHGWKEV